MMKEFPGDTAYSQKARSLLFNLKDPKNNQIRQEIIKGNLTPSRVVKMTPKELANDSKRQSGSRSRRRI